MGGATGSGGSRAVRVGKPRLRPAQGVPGTCNTAEQCEACLVMLQRTAAPVWHVPARRRLACACSLDHAARAAVQQARQQAVSSCMIWLPASEQHNSCLVRTALCTSCLSYAPPVLPRLPPLGFPCLLATLLTPTHPSPCRIPTLCGTARPSLSLPLTKAHAPHPHSHPCTGSGRLFLFYSESRKSLSPGGDIKVVSSSDLGETWSAPALVYSHEADEEVPKVCGSRLLVAKDGTWYLPGEAPAAGGLQAGWWARRAVGVGLGEWGWRHAAQRAQHAGWASRDRGWSVLLTAAGRRLHTGPVPPATSLSPLVSCLPGIRQLTGSWHRMQIRMLHPVVSVAALLHTEPQVWPPCNRHWWAACPCACSAPRTCGELAHL